MCIVNQRNINSCKNCNTALLCRETVFIIRLKFHLKANLTTVNIGQKKIPG